MLFEQRKQQIMAKLFSQTTVTIQELVAAIGVSESTLRRDLITLEQQGLLSRIHGGATLVKQIGAEQDISQRTKANQSIKMQIAEHCQQLVKANSQIYVDAGTATLALVRLLPADKNIHLVTNGLDHALLALQRGIEVTVLGDTVKPVTHAIAGITAYQQLSKMNFEFAFMGMNGLSVNYGLTTTNIDEANLKECAMQQSQHIRILMDDSKLEQIYEFKVEAPDQAIVLFNERAAQNFPDMIKALNKYYNLQFIAD